MCLLNTFWEPTEVKGGNDIFLDPLKMEKRSLLTGISCAPLDPTSLVYEMYTRHTAPTNTNMPYSQALLWRNGELSKET